MPSLVRIAPARWIGILSRTVAAVFGGYALGALAALACAVALPLSRADAVLTGMMLSFAVHAGAVVWVFSVRDAVRAWLGLALPAAVLALIAFLFRMGGPA